LCFSGHQRATAKHHRRQFPEKAQMKKIVLAGLVATLGAVAAPAFAEDGISYNIGLFTDYRFRGVSQTQRKPALQGGADFTSGGFYLGTWASTISKTAYPDSAGIEWDIYGGYKFEVTKELTLDVGLLQYVYPGESAYNTTELYGAATFGPATLKYSTAVSSKFFGVPDARNSGYLELNASFPIAKDWTLNGHIGRQKTKSGPDSFTYEDYLIGVSTDAIGATWSVSAVGASEDFEINGKKNGKAGIVLGVKKTF
jgi:uncharacterized protein (TIGR02001 family)